MNKLLTSYNEFLLVREYSKPEEKSEREKRLLFLVDYILDITTYCEEYSLKIGEEILDIMKHIYKYHNRNDNSITPYSNYFRKEYEFYFSVYIQFIIQYLEWGANIYSAWFDSSKEIEGMKLTSDNIAKVIKWLDGDD